MNDNGRAMTVWPADGIDRRAWRAGVLAIVIAFILFPAVALADPLTDCDSDDAERIVAGCSIVIARGGLADEDMAIAYSRRSDAYLAYGNFDDAFADRAKALALDPAGPNYRERLRDVALRQGDAALAEGDADTAVTSYGTALEIGPAAGAVLDRRSDAHLARGDTAAAIADLIAAEEIGESVPARRERLVKLYELRAVQSLQSEDFADTIAAYDDALEWAARTPDCAAGPCLARSRLEAARVEAILARGETKLEGGRAASAAKDFETYLDHDPNSRRVRLLLAVARESSGETELAAREYRAVLDRRPGDEDAVAGLARLEESEEQLAKLIQIELKRVGCDPGPIDGQWGRKSRIALDDFAIHANATLDGREPSRKILAALGAQPARVCSARVERAAEKDLQVGADEECFIFNNRLFCE